MADIFINTRFVEAANSQLPAIISRVGEVNSAVSRVRLEINASILSRGNLRERLKNTHSEIDKLDKELHELHRTVNRIVQLYEENEFKQLNRIRNVKDN